MRTISQQSTNKDVQVRILDATGIPVTTAAYDTAGLAMWYRREGGLKVAITLATLATVDAAHTDGGFIHIGDGVYRLDLPDAAVAEGADHVYVSGSLTDCVVVGESVNLLGNVYQFKQLVSDKNTSTITDRFGGVWVKNGADLVVGVTDPTVQIVKMSDYSDLVAEAAMTAGTGNAAGAFKYDNTAAPMTPGEMYLLIFTATIDGATRTSRWFVTRDAN